MIRHRLRMRLRPALTYAAFLLFALALGAILSGYARTAQAKQPPALTPSPTLQPSPTSEPAPTSDAAPTPTTVSPAADLAQHPPVPALPTLRSIFAAGIPARRGASAEPAEPVVSMAFRSPLATPPAPAAQQAEVDIWSILPTPTPSAAPITELLAQPLSAAPGAPGDALLPTPTPAPHRLAPLAPTVAPTPDGVERIARVPILMYHYLSAPPPDANIYRQDLSVSPELFAAHLDAMQNDGYTAISLYDLLGHLTQGTALPEKSVIITFDDGYRDNYENAFPLLRQRNMTATFFVVTDFIDNGLPDYFSWDMLREMVAGGMSIESHGRNHVSLRGKDADYLVWQALGSLETIEHELGVRPRFVSYPAGEYDQNTINIFRSANYWAGLTTIQGATHSSEDLYRLRRVRVRGGATPDELLRLLALDW